jgi:hypothetical protein
MSRQQDLQRGPYSAAISSAAHTCKAPRGTIDVDASGLNLA